MHDRTGKLDDDVYVDAARFAALLRSGLPPPSALAVHGHVWSAAPIRDPAHKNWVSRERFPRDRFPLFAHSGPLLFRLTPTIHFRWTVGKFARSSAHFPPINFPRKRVVVVPAGRAADTSVTRH